MAFAGLVDAPHNSAVAFRPQSDGQQVFIGTGEHKLRLYDSRQRRPAQEIELKDAPVTALAAERNGAGIYYCSTNTFLRQRSISQILCVLHRYSVLGCRLTRPN